MKNKKIYLIITLLIFIVSISGCSNKKETIKEDLLGINYDTTSNEVELSQYDTTNPVVAMYIENYGSVVIELYPEIAPNTVSNFISLIKTGFYDNNTFHRLIPGFVLQGGDPTGTGTGGPGYTIKGEFAANDFENNLKHEKGVLSMARTMQPNSAGSQFFIMHQRAPHLDGEYAAFGRVIEGLDVVDKIASVRVNRMDKPLEDQRIKSMTVETFGVEYPEVEKM